MLKYKAVIMTDKTNLNGMKFDRAVLESLVQDQPILSIKKEYPIDNGDAIGKTLDYELTEQGLVVTFESTMIPLENDIYLVAMGICHHDDIEDGVIKYVRFTSLFLTRRPSDPYITPIEKGV